MNTTDLITQSNVIEAAHRFRPALNAGDPLAVAKALNDGAGRLLKIDRLAECEKLSAQVWAELEKAGYGRATLDDDERIAKRAQPIAQGTVIEAAHRFRPELDDPLVMARACFEKVPDMASSRGEVGR